MMEHHIMKSKILALSIALSFTHLTSHANELDKVWDMMLKTGSGATGYSSDTRNGVSLGSARVRIKTYNPNIIAIRAPYIQAGCNGIDFFGGSLSILKKEELVQMGRSLVAAAPMYAFQLAFDQICPDCNAIMADLAKRLEGLNELVKGDCQSLTKAFDSITGANSVREQKKSKLWDTYSKNASAYLPDFASSVVESQKISSESDLENKTGSKLSYNSTYQALKSLTGWDFVLGSDQHTTAQILMSILGTEINNVDTSLTSSAAEGGQSKLTKKHPTISLLDVYMPREVEGGASNTDMKMIKCTQSESADPNCWNVQEVAVSESNALYLKPFKTQIKDLLCGNDYNTSTNFSTSIMSRIPRKQAVNNNQTSLLQKMGPTLRGFIAKNSGNADLVDSNCDLISSMISVDMTISLGQELIQLAQSLKDSPAATENKFVDLEGRVKVLRESQQDLENERSAINQKIIANQAIHNALTGDK